MVELPHHQGAVYILENSEAKRVKVGVTGNHTTNVYSRLNDVNGKWLEQKATCQVCGGRRHINGRGYIPKHVVSGIKCPGSNAPPLEDDVTLAESYIEELKVRQMNLSGSEKGSVTRIINNLEKRITLYKCHKQPVGIWHFHTAFFSDSAGTVESLSHQILEDYLDKEALFGEVFCCSVSEATSAVEKALVQLGLFKTARKEVIDYTTSKKYGECVICGNNLTKRGACPKCMERF